MQECKKLLEVKGGCAYHSNYKALLAHAPVVWDIEDLVQLGGEKRGCPYFASRDAMSGAHLVLAPYNYLLSPLVRKAMDISLKGAVRRRRWWWW